MAVQSNRKILFLGAIIILLSVAAGAWLSQTLFKGDLRDLEASVFPEARKLIPFTLVDQNNMPFNQERLKGKWSFLFFGFTHCPDVCPTTLNTMNIIEKKLLERGIKREELDFIFVSVDPQRDTPKQLKRYLEYFNPGFTGVTGDPAQINLLSRQMGVVYIINPAGKDGEYTVDHSAAILLTEPSGGLRALFTTPHDAQQIADATDKIIHHFK